MKCKWTTLRVSNLETSLDFYKNTLEMKIAEKFKTASHEIVMLGEDDDTKIELIFEKGFSINNPGNGVSIGLAVDNLDKMINKLKSNNLDVQGPIMPNPHIRFFFVKDPDGYTIQLLEEL
ncbi:VOC family protein [Terrisporobacter sp.]